MAVTNQLLMFAETFSKGSTSTGPDGGGLFAVDPTDGSDAGLAESRATGRPLLREFLDHVAELEREDATIRTGGRQRAGGANKSAVSRTIDNCDCSALAADCPRDGSAGQEENQPNSPQTSC